MGQSPTVVLGLGGCLDFEIVWATSVVQSLADRYAVTAAEVDCHLVVDDERDLLRSVLGFMRDGVGGERFVAKPEVVEAFGAHFPGRVTLGGTSLRAAAAMNQHGLPSTVHLVSVDDRMRALLPHRTAYISSADRDSRQPHLIVQYPAGARIILADGAIVATRANRLIYVNDAPNREMVLSPGLGRLLESADVFLVSGLNSVQDMDTLQTRLTELRALMDHIPSTSLVVFEDAGYHVPQTRARVRDALIDRVDVYSMNEDEMEDLLGHRVDLLDPAEIGAAALEITAAVKAPTIVVHTQYWSLAVGLESERFRNALGQVCRRPARGTSLETTSRYATSTPWTAATGTQEARLSRGPWRTSFPAGRVAWQPPCSPPPTPRPSDWGTPSSAASSRVLSRPGTSNALAGRTGRVRPAVSRGKRLADVRRPQPQRRKHQSKKSASSAGRPWRKPPRQHSELESAREPGAADA